MSVRHPQILLVTGWLLGVVGLGWTISRPLIAFGLVGGAVAIWLASKSVAYPLALAGVPTLITAAVGSNPLPKGGATFLTAAWIALAVGLVVIRGRQGLAIHGLMTLPCAMAMLLLGLMVLRLSGSPDGSYGMSKTELYVADNILLLVGAVFVGRSREDLRLFLLLDLAIIFAGSLLLIPHLLAGASQLKEQGRFLLSAQQGSINLGRESSNGALITIGLLLVVRRPAYRNLLLAALPILLVSLVAAGSRGPTVAFVVGLLVLISLSAATGRAQRRLVLAGVGIVGAAIIVPLVVPGSSISRSLSTLLGSSSGLSSNGRSQLWAMAYSAFNAHPLAGIGTGGFGSLSPEQYPHNVFLEMGTELGFIGLVAVTTMIGSMAVRLRAVWRGTSGSERLIVSLVVALFVSALVNALFSGQVSDNADIWLWGGFGIGAYTQRGLATGGPFVSAHVPDEALAG